MITREIKIEQAIEDIEEYQAHMDSAPTPTELWEDDTITHKEAYDQVVKRLGEANVLIAHLRKILNSLGQEEPRGRK